MSKLTNRVIACVTVFCMLLSVSAFAGGGYGKGKKKVGFFAKIGAAIKTAAHKAATAVKNAANKAKTAVKNTANKAATAVKNAAIKTKESIKAGAKKVGMGIKTAGAKVSNALHDSSTWVKQKVTGHKNRTWVCGHYDKNGKWTSGHWRKVEDTATGKPNNSPVQGNSPSQSGDFGQSNESAQSGDYGQSSDAGQGSEYAGGDYGQSGDAGQGSEEAAPAEESPAEEAAPVESGDAVANEGNGEASPEDPVLPDFSDNESATFDDNTQSQEPAEQNAQTAEEQAQENIEETSLASEEASQESDQSSQAVQQGESEMAAQYKKDTQISLRTLGGLMDDLLVQSRSITEFKKTAKPGMSFSVEAQESVNSTYEAREKDAKLLAKVVAWDLQNNNGESGKYFTFFKYRMKGTNEEQRKLINDVIEQVRSSIKHGEGHADKASKELYQQRLNEIANY